MPRPHRSTVLVLVVSLLGTALGTWFTHDVVRRSEHRLLEQKAAEAALILSSLMGQTYGAAGHGLGQALRPDGTVDSRAFAALAGQVRDPKVGLGVTGAALVDLTTGKALATSGPVASDLTDVPAVVRGQTDVVFTRLRVSKAGRVLGLALPVSRSAAAYLEIPVEATFQDVSMLPGQPFAGVDFSVYIGTPVQSHLLWTSEKSKHLDGDVVGVYAGANANDTFTGTTYDAERRPMLVQLEARSPLTGSIANVMPWVLLAFGLVTSLAVVCLLEASQRRKDAALALVDQLERRNGEVDMALQQKDQAEERLRQSQRLEAVGQLAGGIAHDFNNLLAVIISYAGFLKASVPATALEDVDEIDKAAHRAAELTQQLLMFSRREPVRPTIVDARALVADREKLLRRTLSEDIDLVVELPDHPVHLKADAVELDQVVMNLVVNARDAMPYGGRLHVVMTEVPAMSGGTDVQLLVADNGAGMDPEVLEHAFEPFFTTKEVGRGTGLGLATVYGIVTRWGGEVRLSSTPGHGTYVTVQLPRCDAPSETGRMPAQPGRPVGTATVLLVEDEDGVRRATQRILEEAGFEVVVAKNGQQALELFGDGVDVLLTDVVMPGGMSGPDLAEHCRLRRPDLPVVLASGHSRDHLSRRGPLPPGTQLLHKPFTSDALVDAVRTALDNRKVSA